MKRKTTSNPAEIGYISQLLNQLKWTPSDRLKYLRRSYGKDALSQLKVNELTDFRKYLESIPKVGDKVALKRAIRLVSSDDDVTIPQGTIGIVIESKLWDKNYLILLVEHDGKTYTVAELIGTEPPPGGRDEAVTAHTLILEDILTENWTPEDIRLFCQAFREDLDQRFGDGSKLLNESARSLPVELRQKLKEIMTAERVGGDT